ncbi:hypothetical protein FKM82_009261 [Ascaphus truei]
MASLTGPMKRRCCTVTLPTGGLPMEQGWPISPSTTPTYPTWSCHTLWALITLPADVTSILRLGSPFH